MATIEGLTKLVEQLQAKAAKAVNDSDASVVVSYTAEGAIYLHEMMEPKTLGLDVDRPSGLGHFWGPADHGPKYLEGPLRKLLNEKELSRIVTEGLKRGKTMAQSLLVAGLRLQSESQKSVPVEYGALRASAQTTLERGTE